MGHVFWVAVVADSLMHVVSIVNVITSRSKMVIRGGSKVFFSIPGNTQLFWYTSMYICVYTHMYNVYWC
jgi:hypothetical protein